MTQLVTPAPTGTTVARRTPAPWTVRALSTVVVLLVLVQGVQWLGDRTARKIDHR